MRRRSSAGGEPTKAQRRKTTPRKSRIAPKTVRSRSSSAAREETKVARLTRELKEAQEQQSATSDVLQAISRSTVDLQTVLNRLVDSAARLCEAEIANIWRPQDGVYRLAASSRYKEYIDKKEYLDTIAIEPNRATIVGRVLLEGKTVHGTTFKLSQTTLRTGSPRWELIAPSLLFLCWVRAF
jgi:hypothetical protein